MNKREDRLLRISRIGRENRVAAIAIALLGDHARRDSADLKRNGVDANDYKRARSNLDGTFLVRVFAEFESSLRDYWATMIRKTNPRTRDLVRGIASRRSVTTEVFARVDQIREYRN